MAKITFIKNIRDEFMYDMVVAMKDGQEFVAASMHVDKVHDMGLDVMDREYGYHDRVEAEII